VAHRDPEPSQHRSSQPPHRRPQPGHQEGQTRRPRVPPIRSLPAPLPSPRRRHHLAQPAITTPHPNPPIPTQMRRATYPVEMRVPGADGLCGRGVLRVRIGKRSVPVAEAGPDIRDDAEGVGCNVSAPRTDLVLLTVKQAIWGRKARARQSLAGLIHDSKRTASICRFVAANS